mgnify:CR=1 FL=1
MINAVNVYVEEVTKQNKDYTSPNRFSGSFGNSIEGYRRVEGIDPFLISSQQYLTARDVKEMAYRTLVNIFGGLISLDVIVEELEVIGDFNLDRLDPEGVSRKGNKVRRINMSWAQLREFERILKEEGTRPDVMPFLREEGYLR